MTGSPLSLNTTLLIDLGVFLVVVAVVARFVIRPLRAAMDERQARIDTAMEQAQQAEQTLAQAEEEREAILLQAREEGRQIVASAQRVAEHLHAEARRLATAERDRILADASAGTAGVRPTSAASPR